MLESIEDETFFLENKIKELKKQTLKDMDGHYRYFKMDMTVTKKKKKVVLHQVQAQNKPINDICKNKKKNLVKNTFFLELYNHQVHRVSTSTAVYWASVASAFGSCRHNLH